MVLGLRGYWRRRREKNENGKIVQEKANLVKRTLPWLGTLSYFLSWICFDQVKLLTSKIWRKKGKISAKIGFCFWGGMINRVWILRDRPRGACGPEIAEVWGSGCRHLAGLFYSHLTTTFILPSSRLAADSLEHLQKLLFVMLPAILLSLSSRNFFILIQFSWLITQGVLPSFVLSHCIISLYRPSIMTLYHYTCHHTKPSLVPAHCSITLYCNTPLHGIVTLKIILFITLYCLHVPLHHFSRRCLCLAVYVPSPFPHERGIRRQKEDGALRR